MQNSLWRQIQHRPMPLTSSVMRQSVSNFRLYCCSKKFQMLRKNVKSLLEQLQVCIFAKIVFGVRCTLRYHGRLAELISVEKGEDYAKTLTRIRGKVSFSILRSALFCLRGSRSNRRRTKNVKDIDVDLMLNYFSNLVLFFSSSILYICCKTEKCLYCLQIYSSYLFGDIIR